MYFPKVSVVIPTYMEENYIVSCLKTIKNQNYRGKIEIIVADSNSSDKTRELASKFADKVINIKERGISRGRNAGWTAATGEIIVFCDADTKLKVNCVQKIITKYKDPKIVAVCPRVIYHGANGFVEKSVLDTCYNLVAFFTKIKFPLFPGICSSYRSSVLKKTKGLNEKLSAGEDIELSTRVVKHGKCVFINETLASASARRHHKLGIFFPLFFLGISYIEIFALKRKPTAIVYPHYVEITGKTDVMLMAYKKLIDETLGKIKSNKTKIKKKIQFLNKAVKKILRK